MITFTLAKETEYKNINDFYNRINNRNRTIEQFYWEFNNAPAGKAIYVVAKDGEKVIGSQCVIPIDIITKSNKILLTGKSEDTLVDPDYKGKQIFNKMYDLLFEETEKTGINFIWGFTTAKKPFTKMGFEIPYDYIQTLIINKAGKSYKSLTSNKRLNKKDKRKLLLLSYGLKFKSLFEIKKTKLSHYKIEENENTYIKDLANSIKCKHNLSIIHHSEEYIKWRIYENPFYYKVLTYSLYDNNEVLIAIIYLNVHPDGSGYIIESLFSDELDDNTIIRFINNVTKRSFKEGVIFLRNWNFQYNQYSKRELELFQKGKYYKINKGSSLVWKTIIENDTKPNELLFSRLASEGNI